MKHRWQHFLFALLAQLVLPLAPLAIELWLTGRIADSNLAIGSAMYAIAIGVSTKNLPILGSSIVVTVLFSALYGFLVSGNKTHYSIEVAAYSSLALFAFVHAIERYRRHIVKGELFIDLGGPNV